MIAIFDAGKTNKKLFLFNEQYHIVFEQSVQIAETEDEDGFPCEDVTVLTEWVRDSLSGIIASNKDDLKAVNFSTYGASFVHVDKEGNSLTPLYNYLKPFPGKLKQAFYEKYEGEEIFSQKTASPVLGNLNSGLQLYRLKNERPELFEKIHCSLHLPQYLSSIVTRKNYSDITSIGCHTALWDFQKNNYHDWVNMEAILNKMANIFPSDGIIAGSNVHHTLAVGVGLHDSSAALMPYLFNFTEPFVLLSTGTWCISLNPFNQTALTTNELNNDCLCYMEYSGKPIKASRLFSGYEHELQTKRLAAHFNTADDHYTTIGFDARVIADLMAKNSYVNIIQGKEILQQSEFAQKTLADFTDYTTAYHQLMVDIIAQQKYSTGLVIRDSGIKRIFVDGGFSKNEIFMHLLAIAFPQVEIYAATLAQASAMGAALAIHKHWNAKPVPADLIELKYYNARNL
jgi:L-fuculokinase